MEIIFFGCAGLALLVIAIGFALGSIQKRLDSHEAGFNMIVDTMLAVNSNITALRKSVEYLNGDMDHLDKKIDMHSHMGEAVVKDFFNKMDNPKPKKKK